jgi:membrane-associated protein
LWITSLTLIGYFLGRQFEHEIEKYLIYIIIGFIVITTIPLIIAFLRRNIGLKLNKDNTDNVND